MNQIVLAGIVSDASMTTSGGKSHCRATLMFSNLQENQPPGVLHLVAWGQAAEALAVPAAALTIVQGRLTITRAENGASVSTIELSRLHHSSDGAAALNSITVVGRAGRDPEMRYFERGTMVANFTLAVNRRGRDEEPDWFNLEIWGKQAQVAADYVRKGSLLGIIGSFKLDRWTDRSTGEERSKPVIRVDRLELLGSKRDSDSSSGFSAGASRPEPAAAAGPARRSRTAAQPAPVWVSSGQGGDDDVPF